MARGAYNRADFQRYSLVGPSKSTPGVVFSPRCVHPHPKWPGRVCNMKLAEWAPTGFGIRCPRCKRLNTG